MLPRLIGRRVWLRLIGLRVWVRLVGLVRVVRFAWFSCHRQVLRPADRGRPINSRGKRTVPLLPSIVTHNNQRDQALSFNEPLTMVIMLCIAIKDLETLVRRCAPLMFRSVPPTLNKLRGFLPTGTTPRALGIVDSGHAGVFPDRLSSRLSSRVRLVRMIRPAGGAAGPANLP